MRAAAIPAAAMVVAALTAGAPSQAGSRAAVQPTAAEPAGEVLTLVEEGAPGTTRLLVTDDDIVETPDRAAPARAGDLRDPVHRVFVALVAPAGTTTDRLPAAATVQALVTAADRSWSDQTAGRVRFTVAGTVAPYASAHGCDDPASLWQQARERLSAAAGGDVLGPGRHLLLALPPTATTRGCAAGLASIGSGVDAGGVLYAAEHLGPVYAHELGHNLGLAHAGSLRCAGAPDAALDARGRPDTTGCRRSEYDDYLEPMSSYGGARATGNLNGGHLDDLALQPGAVRHVRAPGSLTLRLAPLSDRTGAVRAVALPDGAGSDYVVQYRTATGADAGAPPGYVMGVEVHREDPGAAGGTLMLDMTPTARTPDLDRSLRPGRTFTSASGRVAVTVLGQDPAGATVRATSGLDPSGVAAAVTATAPWSVRRGASFTVTGTPVDARGRLLPRRPLRLQRRYADEGRWAEVARGASDAHGRVVAVTATRRTAYLRWVVPATSGRPAVVGTPVLVRVR